MPVEPVSMQAVVGLIVAAILGAAVGFQRQYTQKPAGIRTHGLVALGSCAFATYSALLGDTRIVAGVITGIGFLGAGAIVRSGMTTRGLTTAASIWTASAIGMGVGLARPGWVPIFLTLFVLTVVLLLIPDNAIMHALPRRDTIAITVDADPAIISVDGVTELIARYVERVRFADALTIGRTAQGRHASIGYILQLDVRENLTDVMETLMDVDGILRVAIRDEPIAPTS
jgi:putative Mg2+ transporter-C (MgtC) family protein